MNTQSSVLETNYHIQYPQTCVDFSCLCPISIWLFSFISFFQHKSQDHSVGSSLQHLSTGSCNCLYNLTSPKLKPLLKVCSLLSLFHPLTTLSTTSFIYFQLVRSFILLCIVYHFQFASFSFAYIVRLFLHLYSVHPFSLTIFIASEFIQLERENRTSHVCWLGSFHTRATLITTST